MKNEKQSQFSDATRELIDLAFREDLGCRGDITATLLDTSNSTFTARIVPRAHGIVAGVLVVDEVRMGYTRWLEANGASRGNESANFKFTPIKEDANPVGPHEAVLAIIGPRREILTIERTLLNFLGRMSGVATLTRKYVDAARKANPIVQVLDTRKTIPGWRELDKYAVTCGGGTNHRDGLYDAILIKDNHVAGVPVGELRGYLSKLLQKAPRDPKPKFVEVEVDNLEQFRAIAEMSELDIILLDNFSLDDTRAAVVLRNELSSSKRLLLEFSGGVTLATIADIAATGVDRISVGALTHSAVNFDYGLDAVVDGGVAK